MGKTNISWTDRSINPIRARHKATGKVGWHCIFDSTGCANCYSQALNGRFGTGLPYQRRSSEDVQLFFDARPLEAMLRMRQRGQKFFVDDMSDLFADFVPFEWIDQVFAYMAMAKDQTFQILTKRAGRMAEYASRAFASRPTIGCIEFHREGERIETSYECSFAWPLPNVWWGVSVENQKYAEERIPALLSIGASVPWVSYEPALGPVDFRPWIAPPCSECGHSLEGRTEDGRCAYVADEPPHGNRCHRDGLGWIVMGGESGPNRRPCEVEWFADAAEQCRKARVAAFVKQDMGPKPGMQGRIPDSIWSIKEFPRVPSLSWGAPS